MSKVNFAYYGSLQVYFIRKETELNSRIEPLIFSIRGWISKQYCENLLSLVCLGEFKMYKVELHKFQEGQPAAQ